MNRRDMIALLGSAAAWPVTARAQRAKSVRIGFLAPTPPATMQAVIMAFREGLRERGYVEGQNLVIEYR
jgi:putative tryptophan/tyrosine transport system substrate-binding protein